MGSYVYLMDMAKHALSDQVKELLGNLRHSGGIALGLVTELAATGSANSLISSSVLPRDEFDDLDGVEAVNEAHIRKVYAAITPRSQTKGILINNGVSTKPGTWGAQLAEAAPTIDSLVKMDFSSFKAIVPHNPVRADGDPLNDLRPPSGEELIAHQMYAGVVVEPSSNVPVPPIRGYALENGLGMEIANAMENVSDAISEDSLATLPFVSFFLKHIYSVSIVKIARTRGSAWCRRQGHLCGGTNTCKRIR